ncbi:MAG TPA: GlsB/YeaQ/YmgE family stress response membrane protein [Caldisericia bacterium]|nr:GlsB/YeaQ/YmgE family stress response membrane protein [Caldisericia bacterium]
MGLLMWIIFGALVGLAASAIMKSSNGLILDTLLGIVGAFLGGWIMSFFNKSGVTGFNLYSFLVALLGAVILIAIVRGIRN